MCQQSFYLLAKRNLTEHGNLAPYSKTKDTVPLHRPYPLTPANRPYVPMTPRPHSDLEINRTLRDPSFQHERRTHQCRIKIS